MFGDVGECVVFGLGGGCLGFSRLGGHPLRCLLSYVLGSLASPCALRRGGPLVPAPPLGSRFRGNDERRRGDGRASSALAGIPRPLPSVTSYIEIGNRIVGKSRFLFVESESRGCCHEEDR